MKKLGALVMCVLLFSFVMGQSFDDESRQSVYVLEQNGLGSSSMQHSLLYTPLSRWEGAILFGQYADTILDRDPDVMAACTFWDVTSSSIIYTDIIKSCQLGLLKGSNGNFNPYASMTRGQLIIVVGRMLSEDPSMELDDAYNYMLQQGVIKVDDRVNSTRIPGRNEVYIMLARFLHNPISSLSQPIKQTLLVRTYIKDPLFDNFVIYAQGSAVLLSESTLLTNAHVVSDVDGEPTGFYEICRVDQIGKDPVCFSSAVLMRVDAFEDLALLHLPKPYTQGQPVTLRTRALRAGDALTVVGFPYDGGSTITTTQGIVAGFEGDMIKTDAAINYGNSGGGAYDGQGNFVGVPTGLYGNIGYVVPITTVQQFLIGDTLYDMPSSGTDQLLSFGQFMQTQHLRIAQSQTSLDTPFFSIGDLDGFNLSANSEYSYNDIVSASYTLSSTDKKTNIYMDVYYIVGEKGVDDHVAEIRNNLDEDYTDVTYTIKQTLAGDWHIFNAKGSSYDKNKYAIYYIYEKDGGLLTVNIHGSALQMSAIEKATSIVDSIKIKTIPSSVQGPLAFDRVTLPLPSFAVMELSINATNHQPYISYDLLFADDSYAYVWLEGAMDNYGNSLTIEDFLTEELDWFYEDSIVSTGVFSMLDGFQGYYIYADEDGERLLYAVVKIVDWTDPQKVFSFVFYAHGKDLSTENIAMLIDYVKTIRIDAQNPFTQ